MRVLVLQKRMMQRLLLVLLMLMLLMLLRRPRLAHRWYLRLRQCLSRCTTRPRLRLPMG